MTDGSGADWIGDWFGTGPDRGIALMFTLAGLIGVAVTLLAWNSKSYRRLTASPSSTAVVTDARRRLPSTDFLTGTGGSGRSDGARVVVDRERDALGVDVAGFARRFHGYRLLVARALEDVADRDHRTRERAPTRPRRRGPLRSGDGLTTQYAGWAGCPATLGASGSGGLTACALTGIYVKRI